MSNGLLSHNDVFDFEDGYYSLSSILLTFSFCFLLRIISIEKISDESPGELGKIIGLDRIPEVKTLRNKIKLLSSNQQSDNFLSQLSKSWMKNAPELAGVLYIDGHQEVYYGKSNKLPKRFISRLRLSMRATTDYWVSDKLGQPFFSVNKHVNGSMIQTIKQDIIPRLKKDVPKQASDDELKNDNRLHKFMIVYDRECYSYDFILDMWEERIACCTYNKYVEEKWSEHEFKEYETENEFGEKEIIKLAERAVLIEGKETDKLPEPQTVYKFGQINDKPKISTTQKRTQKKRKIWAREIRKLNQNGHQTSILTTNYKLSIILIGMYMFARWCQENFFKYMIKNFGLDMLISNYRQMISDTTMLINPVWRKLDKQLRSISGKLKRWEAKFGALTYDAKDEFDEKEFKKYNNKKAELQEAISIYRKELEQKKAERKEVIKKIAFKDLPEDEKFEGVYNERKQFIDTIKMIAYRAETGLATLVKEYTKKPKEVRSLLVQFFKSNADIKVDTKKNLLHINIHHQPTNRDDIALNELCKNLNQTQIIFPETDMKIVYGIA
ncbi:MAG: hypothetical protein K8S18_09930 [Desulfobacula sp.]|nr:hypothetical protein [Desulfobacula sp.]